MCDAPGLANNAFAILNTGADGSVEIRGFGRQDSWFRPQQTE
jgi:hypothetical protein